MRGYYFRLLIIGDVGRGKTRLTARIAGALASVYGWDPITVLDFAPGHERAGAPIVLPSEARVLRPAGLKAPRLTARCCSEMWDLARANAELTGEALKAYIERPTPILVVNDVTIHLHAGDPNLLARAIEEATIFVGNGYYGESLRDECGLTEKERRELEGIAYMVDLVWRL
ncbi:MAG: hypothetical protein ACK4H7_04050 [Acidilobaceae archaeon]